MGIAGQKRKQAGEGDGALAEGQVIALFGEIIMEVGADQPGGKAAEVLFVFDQAQEILGGGVAEIVPIPKRGSRQFLEDGFPEVIGGNLTRILAAFQAEPKIQGCRLFPEPQEDFLHAGPGLGQGLFQGANRGDFFLCVGSSANSTCLGEGLELLSRTAGTGGTKVKNDELGSDRGGGFEGFHGVAFSQPAGRFARIGKFVGVGVGPENFHRNRAKVVQHGDFGEAGLGPGSHDRRPKAVAGVVAEFDRGEAEIGCLAQETGPVRNPVGVPAGGKGKVLHQEHLPKENGEGRCKSEKLSSKGSEGRLGV